MSTETGECAPCTCDARCSAVACAQGSLWANWRPWHMCAFGRWPRRSRPALHERVRARFKDKLVPPSLTAVLSRIRASVGTRRASVHSPWRIYAAGSPPMRSMQPEGSPAPSPTQTLCFKVGFIWSFPLATVQSPTKWHASRSTTSLEPLTSPLSSLSSVGSSSRARVWLQTL